MSQTVRISQTKLDELLSRMNRLESLMARLLEKNEEPQLGTKAWWEWSDKKALRDIHDGKYTEFTSAKDMVNHLKNL